MKIYAIASIFPFKKEEQERFYARGRIFCAAKLVSSDNR